MGWRFIRLPDVLSITTYRPKLKLQRPSNAFWNQRILPLRRRQLHPFRKNRVAANTSRPEKRLNFKKCKARGIHVLVRSRGKNNNTKNPGKTGTTNSGLFILPLNYKSSLYIPGYHSLCAVPRGTYLCRQTLVKYLIVSFICVIKICSIVLSRDAERLRDYSWFWKMNKCRL
jgi:hypothetical protein